MRKHKAFAATGAALSLVMLATTNTALAETSPDQGHEWLSDYSSSDIREVTYGELLQETGINATPDDGVDMQRKMRARTGTVTEAGQTLTVGTAIARYADKDHCGPWRSRTVLTAKPSWVQNTTAWDYYGLGSISLSVGGGQSAGLRIGDKWGEHRWRNENGAKGVYTYGDVCGKLGMIYIGQASHGTAWREGVLYNKRIQIS